MVFPPALLPTHTSIPPSFPSALHQLPRTGTRVWTSQIFFSFSPHRPLLFSFLFLFQQHQRTPHSAHSTPLHSSTAASPASPPLLLTTSPRCPFTPLARLFFLTAKTVREGNETGPCELILYIFNFFLPIHQEVGFIGRKAFSNAPSWQAPRTRRPARRLRPAGRTPSTTRGPASCLDARPAAGVRECDLRTRARSRAPCQHAAVNWRVCCDIHGARELTECLIHKSPPVLRATAGQPLQCCNYHLRKGGGKNGQASPTFLRARLWK